MKKKEQTKKKAAEFHIILIEAALQPPASQFTLHHPFFLHSHVSLSIIIVIIISSSNMHYLQGKAASYCNCKIGIAVHFPSQLAPISPSFSLSQSSSSSPTISGRSLSPFTLHSNARQAQPDVNTPHPAILSFRVYRDSTCVYYVREPRNVNYQTAPPRDHRMRRRKKTTSLLCLM